MNAGPRLSLQLFCRAVLSLLLAVQAVTWLMSHPLMNSYADNIVDYTLFKSAAEVRAAAERNIALANRAAVNGLAGEPAVSLGTNVQSPIEESEATVALQSPENDAEKVASALGLDDRRSDKDIMQALGLEAKEVLAAPLKSSLALDNTALDEIRGGFEVPDSNLKFSFGIERAVFINGELVARTVLNVKDLQMAAGAGVASQMSSAGSAEALSVIQSGTGNNYAPQVGSNVAGTVIQNTLNNQKIQNVTTINAAVNSAQLLRSMSVQSAVQNGIINSLRR